MPDPAAIPPAPGPGDWAAAVTVAKYLGAVAASLGATAAGLGAAARPLIRLARHALGVDAIEARQAAQDRALADIQTDLRELTHADPRDALAALRESVDALRADLPRDPPRAGPPDRPRGR